MTSAVKSPGASVAWARKVNDAWLVHGRLDIAAAAYMDQLEKIDPVRLARSCQRARLLTGARGRFADPKPWFYGGLFSLATPSEAKRYLADHPFVAAVIPGMAGSPEHPELAKASEQTRKKIRRIREKIAALDRP